MNETVQNAADSAVAPAPAAAPVAEEAVQQPAIVASEPAAKVKGKFDEQLGLMLPSDAAQVQAQLSMPGMSDDMVYKIVETHGGNHAVLYKTYDQAVLARDVRDSIENAAGHKVLPIAKAKLGTTYCKGAATRFSPSRRRSSGPPTARANTPPNRAARANPTPSASVPWSNSRPPALSW